MTHAGFLMTEMNSIKTIIGCAAVLFAVSTASAWGRLGHAATIKVAERHLTEKTKANIARYMPYDLAKDAVWMDTHRKDQPIAYTTAWHVYNVDERHEYDPNPRLKKGDCVHAIEIADYNLRHYTDLTDSAVVMNLRMILHFVGDLHCPTHSYLPGPRCFWKCNLNGKPLKTFHGLYDAIPSHLYGKDAKAEDVAAQVDDCRKGDVRKIASGTLYEWVRTCGDNNASIYVINPFNTVDLDPDTVEKSRDLVNVQIRNGGYRLARLLNEYFGK